MAHKHSDKKDKISKINPSALIHKLPTQNKFNKIIDPIINTKKVEKRIGPPKPIMPEYLKDMFPEDNPYTEIKKKKIKDLKADELERKKFDMKKIKDFPIHQCVHRETRINYDASYQTKMLKYSIDMKEIMENMKEPPKSASHQTVRKKFMSNYDFIVDKRKICLLDLAINIKEEQFSKLEKIIQEEEEYLKKENERLQKEYEAHDQYLKSICQTTSDAIKLAERETAKKNKVAEKVKRARYNMAHLNAECVKLEEEYLRLKTYKEFLRTCYKQRERKEALERTSLMKELKIDAILKEAELDKQSNDYSTFDDDSDKTEDTRNKNKHNVNNNENNFDQAQTPNIDNNSTNSTVPYLSKDKLEKMKEYIISGFLNVSNKEINELIEIRTLPTTDSTIVDFERATTFDDTDLDEEDVFFNDPQELVNILSELEANNLSLIENVQEQEEMCDQMRNRINNVKRDMMKQINMIEKHINKEHQKISEFEESIRCIKETEKFLSTFNDLERYKKIFYFGDLEVNTPDEMMDYLHENISNLYQSIFEKVDSTKSNTIEMLKRIESLVDSLYIELQSHGRSAVLKAKKIVDEKKREAARIRQKELCKEAEQLKIKKAMEKALMPPRYRFGRKIMYRSDPPKQSAKAEKIDWDELRLQEENKYFFTE